MSAATPERIPAQSKPPRLLGAILGAGVFLCFLWWLRPLLSGEIYFEDDLSIYHLPLRAFYQECLHAGDSFLWMPHLFNGYFIHGEGQAGMLHPFHFVLYRCLPLSQAFAIETLATYPFLFLGAFLLLRRWKLPGHASLLGAFLWTFVGASVNHYVHMHMVAVLAHLPWQLWAIDIALRGPPGRARGLAPLAVLALSASQLLLGFPQGTYFSWLAELLYAILLAWRQRKIAMLLTLGAAKGFAVLLAAPQLLPTYDMMQYSWRVTADAEFRTSISLRPLNLLQLFNPYIFEARVYGTQVMREEPWDAPYFSAMGTASLLLLPWLWRREKERRLLLGFGAALALLGLLAALGRYGPLDRIFAIVPLVNKFRAPARYIALAHAGMAIIAAFAIAHLAGSRTTDGGAKRFVAPFMAAGIALSLVPAFCILAGRALMPEATAEWLNIHCMPNAAVAAGALFVPIACVLARLAARAGRVGRWAIVALLIFTLADVGLYSLRHKPTTSIDALLAKVPQAPDPGAGRIETDIHPSRMNAFTMKGYRIVYGYVSLVPLQRLDFTQTPALRLAGVTWRQTRLGASAELSQAYLDGRSWIPLPAPLPRARLVAAVRATDDPAAMLPQIDPETTVLLDHDVTLSPGPPGEATVTEESPGRVSVRCDAPDRRILALAESYHAGWQAEVNGARAEVMRAYGDFMAVEVPGGLSSVDFVFAPTSYRLGLWLFRLAFAALPVLCVFFLWLARKAA